MEYLCGGSLRELINRTYDNGAKKPAGPEGNKIRPIDASRIIKGVLEAVAYLHGFDIAHRDLKPGKHSRITSIDNIMFAKQNDSSSLKLIDFGLSAKYNNRETTTLTDKCGTAIYMAPEVFTNYQYSKVI